MNKILDACPFPITFQTTFTQTNSFISTLETLNKLGFYGIEINLPNLDEISTTELKKVVSSNNLDITYLATGAYAKKRNLSLSSKNTHARQLAIDGCFENILYASELNAGIILGFFKSNPKNEAEQNSEAFTDSINRISDFAKKQNVNILIEATNRYESIVMNSISETTNFVQKLDKPNLSMLPDTFHMNIEETDFAQSLSDSKNYFSNIHFSDNNRLFPGLGAIDFKSYFDCLSSINYNGTIAIEGNVKSNICEELRTSAKYLADFFS